MSLSQAAGGQPATLTGTVIGTEQQKQATGKEPVEVDVLNLWCADGMRAVKLADVQRVRFLNPALDGEFKKALEALAQSHDAQKKAVSLLFAGKGKRRVSVGYVVENPIWKTTYRLVLGKDKDDKPYLQGWAVVENPSDEDWRDVRMALVSGPADLLPDGPVPAAVRAAAAGRARAVRLPPAPSPTAAALDAAKSRRCSRR